VLAAVALSAATLLSAAGAVAQGKDPQPIPHGKSQLKGQTKEAPAAAQPSAKAQVPDGKVLAMLVQSHITALSQANLTGNYTVLNALGAPSFRQANPPEKLAEIFNKNLRDKGIDLTPVIIFQPILVREPVINQNGLLHVIGYYKTEPQQVNFEMLFQAVNGYWMLFGIAVNTSPANQPPGAANPPVANAPAAATAAPDPAKKTK
jgi:hypothetical protein